MAETTITGARGDSPDQEVNASSSAEVVQVRLPAAKSYVSLLRTITASLAARAHFTIDEIEDLRIAVDEACAMIITQAINGAELTCTFTFDTDALEITVTVPSESATPPDRDGFGWIVLSSLAGGADAGHDEGALWIRLHKTRQYDTGAAPTRTNS